MATLNAEATTTISLSIGQFLYVNGQAEVYLAAGQMQTVNGEGRFGPYQTAVDITIKAITNTTIYENWTGSFGPEFLINESRTRVVGVKHTGMAESGVANEYSLNKYTSALMPFFPSTQLGAAIRTFHVTTCGPDDFVAVQLILTNVGASTTLTSASIAVNETAASPIIPVIDGTPYDVIAAAGTQNGWLPVTFAGAASIVIPVGSAQAPSYVISDAIPILAEPRADGGRYPLIMARTYYNGTAQPIRQASSSPAAVELDTLMAPYGWKSYVQSSVDGVGAPNTFTSTSINNNVCAIGFIFHTRAGVATVVTPGDSIMSGSSETATDPEKASNIAGGWCHRAIRRIAARKYVGYANLGISGATPTEYTARLQAALTAGIPASLIIHPVWSPNPFPPSGTPTSPSWYMNAVKVINLARQYFSRVLFVTPTPYEAWSNSTRETARANIIAMGVPYVDMNKIFYDPSGAGDNKWISTYRLDGTHPNLAGHIYGGIVSEPIIDDLLD